MPSSSVVRTQLTDAKISKLRLAGLRQPRFLQDPPKSQRRRARQRPGPTIKVYAGTDR